MTAPAIYRYFPSLEALVCDVCNDLYAELSAAIEIPREQIPADRPADRLLAMARSFRRWSIQHPAEFALMFGEPIAGASLPEGAWNTDAAPGFCLAFLAEFTELSRRHQFRTPPPTVLSDRFADLIAPDLLHQGLPVEAVYLFLSGWIRLYGLVAMEVFGHLSWAFTDVEPLFESDMAAYFHQLMVRD